MTADVDVGCFVLLNVQYYLFSDVDFVLATFTVD